MMRRIKEGILLIYALMIMFCCALVYINNHEFYNKVKVVDDRQEIEQRTETSIPVKIEISNDKLGAYIMNEEVSMKDTLDSIKEITYAKNHSEAYEYDENQVSIKGTIYYLNGNKEEFLLSNRLKINNKEYIYNRSAINTLRNTLINHLYNPTNLAGMITRSKVIEVFDTNRKTTLNEEQKSMLKDELAKSNNVVDNNKLISLKSGSPPLYHINVYFNEKTNGKANSFDVAIIDVFNDYYVFQYLGDENGRQIYFTSSLNKLSFLEGKND